MKRQVLEGDGMEVACHKSTKGVEIWRGERWGFRSWEIDTFQVLKHLRLRQRGGFIHRQRETFFGSSAGVAGKESASGAIRTWFAVLNSGETIVSHCCRTWTLRKWQSPYHPVHLVCMSHFGQLTTGSQTQFQEEDKCLTNFIPL
jgi:hypothetical protein